VKFNKILFFCLLVMLPLLVYLPTLKHELIWDSKPMILENDLLKGEFSLSASFRSGYWASTSQMSSGYDYYRPLMVLSFMAEKAAWGLAGKDALSEARSPVSKTSPTPVTAGLLREKNQPLNDLPLCSGC